MNQVDAPIAGGHVSNSVVAAVVPVPGKIVLCIRRFALLVVRKQQSHLNLPATGPYIAETVFKLDARRG
jgi:hypothetical protein